MVTKATGVVEVVTKVIRIQVDNNREDMAVGISKEEEDIKEVDMMDMEGVVVVEGEVEEVDSINVKTVDSIIIHESSHRESVL